LNSESVNDGNRPSFEYDTQSREFIALLNRVFGEGDERVSALCERAMSGEVSVMRQLLDTISIIIDSGATAHMLPTKECLYDYTTLRNVNVKLGDENVSLMVEGVGSNSLLSEVLHVPRLSFGLISVPQLDDEAPS